MIDTHCHIYLPRFEDDLQEVLDRAAEAGVEQIMMPAINKASLQQMERLEHPRIRFHKMVGLHPTEINDGKSLPEELLFDYCNRKDIMAVGETGLDYHWSTDYKEDQKRSLRMHCRVSKSTDKPVILHNRDSTDDLLDIIEEEQGGTLSGIWHCFNGTVEEGRRAIDLGLHLGIGGVLTFKNAGVDASVARLPLEKMVLETDAPYLSPEPKRGKRNEPAFVKYTAERLAEVKEQPVKHVIAQTTNTALKLFGLS